MRSKKALSAVILSCIVLLGFSATALAESPGKISGRVLDAWERSPLYFINVIVTSSIMRYENGTITDAEGNYVLAGIPPGQYRVKYQEMGYRTIEYLDVDVLPNVTTFIHDVEMTPVVVFGNEGLGNAFGSLRLGVLMYSPSGKWDCELSNDGNIMVLTKTNARDNVITVTVLPQEAGIETTRKREASLRGHFGSGFYYDTGWSKRTLGDIPCWLMEYEAILGNTVAHAKEYVLEARDHNYSVTLTVPPAAWDSTQGYVLEAETKGSIIEMKARDFRSWRKQEVTDPEPAQISSRDLKHTVVSAHMEVPIEPGENVLYCSTFQIAWNAMQDSIIKEDILLEGDLEIARMLNKQLSKAADISEDCYLARVGFLTQGLLDSINQALKEKFGDQAPPKVVEPIVPDLPTFFAYAYLFKNLEFEHIFQVSTNPISFVSGNDTTKLKAFNVGSQEQRDQVAVLDYVDDNDFVIGLRSKSPKDEIILAKIPPRATVLATIQSVQERIAKSPPSKVESDEPVKIPKCDFNVIHTYDELMRKNLLNTEGWFVSKAVQWTRFRLNEKGIILRSEARFAVSLDSHPVDIKRRPRQFIFDKPFLICLREKEGRYPYFAMWVDNPELMLKW
jgi:hypothetical protein